MEETRVRKVRKSAEQISAEKKMNGEIALEKAARLAAMNLAMLERAARIVTEMFIPVRILKSGVATIVFWKDGTKTVVKCAPETTSNDYDAFTSALAIKLFSTNSRLKKLIREKTVVQPEKAKAVKTVPEEQRMPE